MTLPRPVYPGRTLMVTRRCTQRQFLLAPGEESNNAVVYCLAIAAQKFDIDVLGFVQMSNHLHELIFDRYGNAPAFCEHFHKLLAKCINGLRGRSENVFATEDVSYVELADVHDIVDKLVYVVTNPVNSHLVEHVREWPGANGYQSLLEGRTLRATRPRHFFAEDGVMPEEVTLQLHVPADVADQDLVVRELKERVEAAERLFIAERARTGSRVIGRRNILRQSWRDTPTSREPRRGLRPRVAAKSIWARVQMLQRNKAFVVAYRLARKLFVLNRDVEFPEGTYWLRRHMGVAVLENR